MPLAAALARTPSTPPAPLGRPTRAAPRRPRCAPPMATPPRPERLTGVTAECLVARGFEGVLLDQFGVLHDGRTPYPGAVDAVRAMAEAGMRIVIVSNSSRRSAGALAKIAKMGFREDWFVGVVTSGELTYRHLRERPAEGPWRGLGDRAVWFTWGERGAISLEGTGVTAVGLDVDAATFILAHGTEAMGRWEEGGESELVDKDVGEMVEVLRRLGRERGGAMPMVVANPDFVTVDATQLRPMPGMLGREYAKAGGEVVLMGKPAPVIYEAAMEMLGGVDPSRVVAIGDSLEHDVAGAGASGVASLFVSGGIHAEETATGRPGEARVDEDAVARLCGEMGVTPTFLVDYLA